ncbi:DUF2336 domain-containing protein [Telmatospirillum sp.]|uniref:DUF2336 domain-containing protein n=1 Tax=Telmatospirillum sp. TaxID=2079197 RepID=UPI00283F9D1C|nr:DUF2336 domain-containing protein [Telmatospirillum sp.]MDR3438840.1 DUF2336 domain-containing protein [Telmatospirillum sp.]
MPPKVENAGSQRSLEALRNSSQTSDVLSRERIGIAVAELYTQRGDILSDHERSLIHDILRRVIHDLEADLRRRLAEFLSSDPSVPRELAALLANDQADVAWPMLVNSPALLDDDLIDIVRARGTEHRLAIAARKRVSMSVSAALVETGDQNVIVRLLNNQNAEIARATYEHLVAESRRVDSFQQPLVQRRDIPQDLLMRIYQWVGGQLREEAERRLGLPRETVDTALKQAVASGIERDKNSPTTRLATRLVETGAATPRLLTTLLSDGHISIFSAILSQRTGIASHKIIAATADVGGEAQTILCRAVGFSQEEFLTLLDESFRLCMRPRTAIEQCRHRLSELYPRLTEIGARRALAAWAAGAPMAVALRQAEVM